MGDGNHLPSIYFEDDFYKEHGTDYRYLYNVPQMLMFFLHYQMMMMLCTSVCTEAGFGVYPAKCEPLPGYGPSTKISVMKMALGNHKIALEQEYNFAMLKCFDNTKLIKGPMMKDTLRGWDMPTRYWFWSNIYKNLIKANKEVR
ncbi:unnamed protein product [Diatraea saccharalis]|uniref:Uncharacterized protein n=1 Tax=Diatraea saccharalis TaxID=40085 RepID=A0A9P0C9X6_9NEOP|nr:unnamed protein product [Diatraea saccharalis]